MAHITNPTARQSSGNTFIDTVFSQAISRGAARGVLGISPDGQPRMYEAAKTRYLLAARMPKVIRNCYSTARKKGIEQAQDAQAAVSLARRKFASQMKLVYGNKIARQVGAAAPWGRRRPLSATGMERMVQRAERARAANQAHNEQKMKAMDLRGPQGFLAHAMDHDGFKLHRNDKWKAFPHQYQALFTQFEQMLADRAEGGNHRLSTQDFKALYREVFQPTIKMLHANHQKLFSQARTEAMQAWITNAHPEAAVWQQARKVYVEAANLGLIEPEQIEHCLKLVIQRVQNAPDYRKTSETEPMGPMDDISTVEGAVAALSQKASAMANAVLLETIRKNAIQAAGARISQDWQAPPSMIEFVDLYLAHFNRNERETDRQDPAGWKKFSDWYKEGAQEYVALYTIDGCSEPILAAAIETYKNKTTDAVQHAIRNQSPTTQVRETVEKHPEVIARYNQGQIAEAMRDGGLFYNSLTQCLTELNNQNVLVETTLVLKKNWTLFIASGLAPLASYAHMLLAQQPAHRGRLTASSIEPILTQVAALYKELYLILKSNQQVGAALCPAHYANTAEGLRGRALQAAQQMAAN